MTRSEKALAECDRLIAGYEVAPGGHITLALLHIGRDVLTRHHPEVLDGRSHCDACATRWPCAEAKLWLDLLAPEVAAMTDEVDYPSHYNEIQNIECIDVIEHFSFLRGTAIKYLWRAGMKGDAHTDLRKALWYINRELTNLDEGVKHE